MHTAMTQPVWNFEEEPYSEPADETAINFRAYLDRMPDEKMREYGEAYDDGDFEDDFACLSRLLLGTNLSELEQIGFHALNKRTDDYGMAAARARNRVKA